MRKKVWTRDAGPSSWFLIGPSRCPRPPAEALVHRLASLKAGFHSVPVLNGALAHPPAQQYDVLVQVEREIEEPGIEVLHLYADRVDLRDALAHAVQVRLHLRSLPRHIGQVDPHPSGEINAAAQLGKLRL